jgi:hypothetical protein
MSTTITGVVTNGVIVPTSPLPEGAAVEVIVASTETPEPGRLSMLEFLDTLPPGPRAFKTWQEYARHLHEEKEEWDH